MAYILCITPNGHLVLAPAGDDAKIDGAADLSNDVASAFQQSCSNGLTMLASQNAAIEFDGLPPAFEYFRQFARRYFAAICRQFAQAEEVWTSPAAPDEGTLVELLTSAPTLRGLEYASPDMLRRLWRELDAFTQVRVAASKRGVAEYLKTLDPAWNLVGRVTFHLAENKKNPDAPFAFLATYTEGSSKAGSPQHIPLSEALKQSLVDKNAGRLEELLEPVIRASKSCKLVGRLLDSRALFAPQAWGIRDAYEFLTSVPEMESAGVVVRVPNWWNATRPPRPQVSVRIGSIGPTTFSANAALDFKIHVAIDGQPLGEDELKQLLTAREGMALLRGKWVQVDQAQLQDALQHWKQLQKQHVEGIDFLQGMRLLAGATFGNELVEEDVRSWTRIEPGEWLGEMLNTLRDPSSLSQLDPNNGLNATLRHYQVDGVRWLWFATQLGLGVCLADDMGLGKTIQVISLLTQWKLRAGESPINSKSKSKPDDKEVAAALPSLLIVPTSLLGNWQREVNKFGPHLRLFVAHRSANSEELLKAIADDPGKALAEYDLVVTTYGLARNANWLQDRQWRMVILDEAQAIKNASSAQTKSIKKIQGRGRIILTGTPVENHLGDLWSLFDFCSPGLLGSAAEFKKYASSKDERERTQRLASIRKLIRPYVLRRLKTDPNVVPDLPAKTEMRVDCGLSPTQAALYREVLKDLERTLEIATGIQRRGLVLSVLMQLKQICNHPALYLKQPSFDHQKSGKFAELETICDTLIEKQEKMLVFTQFQSMCGPLQQFLKQVFGRDGLVLTGKTDAAKRSKLVAEFQEELGPPFFVISVKAGGTGLNLTQASHVVHFDRWWNPAVEDQATDRAFRIGQKRNVLVHKFVCRGTLEERIDELIQSKKQISRELFSDDGELNLTEMSNEQLMSFIALDLSKATSS